MSADTQDLEALLGKLVKVAEQAGDRVPVEAFMDAVGRRSFGPLLFLSGVLGMTPVSAVPGAPTTLAAVTALIAVQLLFGRDSLWLPGFIRRLSVRTDTLRKTVKLARRPARFVDRLVRPRLQFLARPLADRAVALACLVIAALIPPLELLPFVAFVPATAIAAFGLGLLARDGLLVLLAFTISAGVLGTVAYRLIG